MIKFSEDIDHTVAAALPISGLTAWQGMFDHGHLTTGQTVLIHGAAGGVGSIAVQLAREVGARVIGTGRDTALALGVDTFIDLQHEKLKDADEVDIVFDVIGGDILDRSAALVRVGGTLVTITMPPRIQPNDGRAVFFVVEPRPRPARRIRHAAERRPAQAGRRRCAAAHRSTRRVRPRQAPPWQNDHPHHGRPRGPIVIGKRIRLRTSLGEFVRLWLDPTCRAGKDWIQGGAG
jgi:NADPH:quinone reductase-like Zn-dependent oxidoreductase